MTSEIYYLQQAVTGKTPVAKARTGAKPKIAKAPAKKAAAAKPATSSTRRKVTIFRIMVS